MNTGNITCLYTNTAGAHASGEFAVIPPAGVDDDTFVKTDCANMSDGRLMVSQ